MGDYSTAQLAAAARSAGFQGTGLITAIAVSLAEDGRQLLRAQNRNSDGSIDRGPWQINSRWHPEVPDSCAYDLNCSAQAAYRISSGGASWSPWATFNNGAYRAHLADAQAAAGSSSGPVQASTFGISLPSSNPVGDSITRAAGKVVGTARGAGNQLQAGAQIGLGLFVVVAGAAVLVFLLLRHSSVGRGIRRTGSDLAAAAVALVPK